jgi:hypothetical protein
VEIEKQLWIIEPCAPDLILEAERMTERLERACSGHAMADCKQAGGSNEGEEEEEARLLGEEALRSSELHDFP